MKRLLALLLVLMLSFSFSAVAEDVDVKALDNDALTILFSKAQEEILERGLYKILPIGVYTGDGDIPKGLYVCKALSAQTIELFSDYDAYLSGKKYFDYWTIEESEEFILRLYGNICYKVPLTAIILSFTPAE